MPSVMPSVFENCRRFLKLKGNIMLKHETWPIDRLIEYARNPRKNDHAVDRVAAAVREFGFRVPLDPLIA